MPAKTQPALETEPEATVVDPLADVKFPVDAKTTARIVREDARHSGGKVTDKAIRRLVREHDIAGMDDDRYTRHSYDRATLELILETWFAPKDRRAAQTESDAPEAPAEA
jgi:fructose-bisphosphate aldolase class 1